MKNYRVVLSQEAENDLQERLLYLINDKHSPWTAKNVMKDYNDTKIKLSYMADALPVPDNDKLRLLGLKRMNFSKHDYFMLFTIEGDKVIITNIFHAREDFENKL